MHKCKYGRCLHESRDISPDDEIKVGAAYYHKDCYEFKQKINQIIDDFYKVTASIDSVQQLRSIVNKIIFLENHSPDEVLWIINNLGSKMHLSHPGGLLLLVRDEKVEQQWKNYQVRKVRNSIENTNNRITAKTDENYTYVPRKKKGFADVLCS